MIKLAQEYIERMKRIVPDWQAFISCYDKTPSTGIRINTLKFAIARKDELSLGLSPVSFCEEGFVLSENEEKIGKSVWHHCGAVYSQEPAAMSAVVALDPQPGERILDMCAAPGGKSTQIAAKLGGEGLLICNEYVKTRAQALISNLERLGVKNSAVCSCDSELIAQRLPEYFDRVLVDAPCSGEGMFRKSEEALLQWSPEYVKSCAALQRKIIENATECLAPGGVFVYSTCTFAPAEDEELIIDFLEAHPEFSLEPIKAQFGTPGLSLSDKYDTTLCRRLYPSEIGEGHFVARLRKKGEIGLKPISLIKPEFSFSGEKEAKLAFLDFAEDNLNALPQCEVVQFGEHLYAMPNGLERCLPFIRSGVLLGEIKKGGRKVRFEPAHAFYCASKPQDHKRVIKLEPQSRELAAFLSGEEIACDDEFGGYAAICCSDIITGFGKCSAGRVKNHYPKGLRLKA